MTCAAFQGSAKQVLEFGSAAPGESVTRTVILSNPETKAQQLKVGCATASGLHALNNFAERTTSYGFTVDRQ